MELDLSDYSLLPHGLDESEQLDSLNASLLSFCVDISRVGASAAETDKSDNLNPIFASAANIAEKLSDPYLLCGVRQRQAILGFVPEKTTEGLELPPADGPHHCQDGLGSESSKTTRDQQLSQLEGLLRMSRDAPWPYKLLQILGNIREAKKGNSSSNSSLNPLSPRSTELTREVLCSKPEKKDKLRRQGFARECGLLSLPSQKFKTPPEHSEPEPETQQAGSPPNNSVRDLAVRLCLQKALFFAPTGEEKKICLEALRIHHQQAKKNLKNSNPGLGPLLDEGTRHIAFARALVSQRLRKLLFLVEKVAWRKSFSKLTANVRRFYRQLTRLDGFVREEAPLLESILTEGCHNRVKKFRKTFLRRDQLTPIYLVLQKYVRGSRLEGNDRGRYTNFQGGTETTSVLRWSSSSSEGGSKKDGRFLDLREIRGFVYGPGCVGGRERVSLENWSHCFSIVAKPEKSSNSMSDKTPVASMSLGNNSGPSFSQALLSQPLGDSLGLQQTPKNFIPNNTSTKQRFVHLVFDDFFTCFKWLTGLQLHVKHRGYNPTCTCVGVGKILWLRTLYNFRQRLGRPHFSFCKCVNGMWSQVRLLDPGYISK